MSAVVIAGAGPNGLMLAAELCLAGVRPVLLERLAEPDGVRRANGLVGQVVPLLHRRGLFEKLAGVPEPTPVPRFVFGAFPVGFADLPRNPMYILGKPQHELEQLLTEHVRSLGADLRRGHEITGFTQDEDSVTVRVNGPDGPYEIAAEYLVGADGGRSTVRKLAGIEFPGVTWDETVSRSANVRLPRSFADPVTGGLKLETGVLPPFQHHRTETGVFVFAPFDPENPTLSVTEHTGAAEFAEDDPLTLDELRASVHRVLGVDLPLEPPSGPGPFLLRRLSGGNTRIAETYRRGRVLLVGDAAHVHSAIGGPGLNLGLQDAANLAWKLAAEVRGWAPPGLLDSYEAERRPVSERVVMHTQAQSALVAPGPEVTALREFFGELLSYPDVRQHVADLMSGADLHYGTDPDSGRWAPDLPLADPAPLTAAYRAARPVLLDLTPGAVLADAAEPWKDRVTTVLATATGDAPTALLIRPDGYVAWSSTAAEPDVEALRSALTQWFGAPVRSAVSSPR
ncbi:FAD-dependent monooxygenase [Amycolatopsis sp. VS8301801F10]|uniref:FAD-dependent monooxygenase n=1 Tax=Amycolatopsis sp. VS8301801F10 TaxID=2652442 RepID=UPI0038FC5C14